MGRTKHWMHTRKERLTRAQETTLPQICEKWRKIALSTEPADRKKAQQGVSTGYKLCTRKQPREFIWLDSIFQFTEDLHRRLEPRLTFPSRLSTIEQPIYLGAVRFYKDAVVKQVQQNISSSVPSVISPPRLLGSQAHGILHGWINKVDEGRLGSDQARALALADFFATPWHATINDFTSALEHCAGFWIYQNAVVFLERPRIMNLDQLNRLHSLNGPALEYRDGSVVHAIHGIRVAQKWIDTPADQLDIETVMQEENGEIRRALIAKIGFHRLLDTAKHKTISKMKRNALIEFVIPGRRWMSAEKPGIATLRMRALHLKWKDKTGDRETLLPVPRLQSQFGTDRPANCDSAEQVRRWTLGWPKEALAVAET